VEYGSNSYSPFGQVGAPTTPLASVEDLVSELRPNMYALVVCLSNAWGGLEQVASQDAINLASLGLHVRVLCIEGSPTHTKLAGHPELRTITMDHEPRKYCDFTIRSILLAQIADGVNLIHVHQTSLLGSIVPWIWNMPRVALFASRHIMNNHDKRDFLHRMIYSRVDKLIVMSHALRRNVMQTHAIRERQVKVVSLGLDFEAFDSAQVDTVAQRRSWGADDDTVVVGVVGRIDPAKGQATFIRAAAGLSKNAGKRSSEGLPEQKIKYVIVGEETRGSDGSYSAELKEMVRQFGLEETVIFTGFQKNIPEIMRSLDIFVMPSREETFGLVAIEAMAMETPIVISKGGSSTEIVGEDEFGLTVRQLGFLLDHPERRREMGRLAREHVKQHYDRKVRIQKTLALYERMLRSRGVL
jgi:glycosyltransferase involved in cell wall biosynthesis